MQARKATRASVPLLPRYRNSTGWEFVDGQCVDISVGGMFIAAVTPLESGALLKFECEVAGEALQLRGVGRVVWQRTSSGERDRPSGMGLKFVKLDPGCAELIDRLVQDAQAHGTTAPTQPFPAHYVLTESFPPSAGLASATTTGRLSVIHGSGQGDLDDSSEVPGVRQHSERVPAGTVPRDAPEPSAARRHAVTPGTEPVLGSPARPDGPLRPGVGAWLTMAVLALAVAAWVLLR